MSRTAKGLSFLGTLALAAWLSAPAAAQQSSEISSLRAEVAELRAAADGQATASDAPAPPAYGGCCDNSCGCDSGCCEAPCCGCCNCCCHAGWWVEGEALFLKYHRADGVDDIRADRAGKAVAEFGYEISPRITVGYTRCDGLGVRARWWHYDHDSSVGDDPSNPPDPAGNFFVSIDTTTIDLEVFRTFDLCPCLQIEVAGGARYNEFKEDFVYADPNFDLDFQRFRAWGGIASLEMRTPVTQSGALFVRGRCGVLSDDATIAFSHSPANPHTYTDVIRSVTELTMGAEYCQPLFAGYFFVKAEAEWQNWNDYDELFQFNGVGSVGFIGFGFSVGVAR